MKSKAFPFVFILLFCLSSINFFSPTLIPPALIYYSYYGFFSLAVLVIVFIYKKSSYNTFAGPILIILIAEIGGAINASYSWNQSLTDSFKAVLSSMSYILFLVLITWQLKIKEIEKLVLILGAAFIVIYLFSFLIYPKVIFGVIGNNEESRGFQRIRTDGIGFLFLLSFFALNKYILNKKFFFLAIYILTLVCIVMSLTRTYIIFSIVFSAVFILKNSSNLTKVMAIVIGIAGFYLISRSNFYKLMAKQTNEQSTEIKDDIRVLSADFYLNNFSPNAVSEILGNGEAYKDTEYSKYIDYLELGLGYYTSDIGYIGFYVKFGILVLISYLVIFWKVIKRSVSEEYLYSQYFLIFIFSISFIIDCPFNTNFIPSFMLALYIFSRESRKKYIMDDNEEVQNIS